MASSRRARAQIDLDVRFIGKTAQLYKDIEDVSKNLKLDSSIAKNFSNGLEKAFRSSFENFDKLSSGLSKKGLTPNQYTDFFNKINLKIQENRSNIIGMRDGLKNLFNSAENKANIKELENYQKQLEKINDLLTKQRISTTKQETSKRKLLEEKGLDWDNDEIRKMLTKIKNQKGAKKKLTSGDYEWLAEFGLKEEDLERILELIKQIENHTNKIRDYNKAGKAISGSSNLEDGYSAILGKIDKKTAETYTESDYLYNDALLQSHSSLFREMARDAQEFGDTYQNVLNRGAAEADEFAKANNTIREVLGQFGIALSAGFVVGQFKRLAVASFEFYRSLDSALNEIYVVSNLTSDAVAGLTGDFINMAKKTGMALDDVTRAAVLFYQQGLNTDEVMEMTKVTSEFAKVAGIDATDAADKLTAAVNGYCLAAEDASLVADKFNKVAAASAADINELSTAFSKAAAQANQAGVSMDNYLAYIATMVEATREAPENIGTSLKTIMSRMQQVKEAGSTEDGETSVNNVEEALRSVGIALRDTNNELRDLEEIFDELGPKWNQLDRNTQAYLGTIIAGTRQQSRFITLMQNWDRVLDLSEQSANSAGQQALMHAKAMDSIESKMQQFKVAWQEFVSNLADSDLFKGLISGLTKIFSLFNSGNKPIVVLSLAVQLFSKRMNELSSTLTKKVATGFKNFKNGLGKTQTALTGKQKRQMLATNEQTQMGQIGIIQKKEEQYAQLTDEAQVLLNKQMANGQSLSAEEARQLSFKQKKIQSLGNEIDLEKQKLKVLQDQNKTIQDTPTKMQNLGANLQNIGVGLTSISLMISQTDNNLGSLMATAGSGATMLGQLFTGNWVGAIASGAMFGYQLWQTIDKWDENKLKRMEDAVAKVNEASTKLVNTNTSIRTTNNLINKYEELSGKMYLTTTEQEELNSTIQEMGDSFDIDTITDEYGNLSINIAEVRNQLKALKEEQAAQLQDLTKAEIEGIDALSTWYDKASPEEIEKYYDELIVKNKTNYRSLVNGISDGLTDDTRHISSTLYQTIQAAFKESILDEVTGDNRYKYDQYGIGQSIENIQKEFNEAMSADDWNYFYSGIETLQSEIDSLSWDDFQNRMDDMFGDWWASIGLTKTQWLELKGVIEDTVYGSDEFTSYMQRYSDNGSDYESKQASVAEYKTKLADKDNNSIGINQKIRYTGKRIVKDGYEYTEDGTRLYGGFSEPYHYYKGLEYQELYSLLKEYGIKKDDFKKSGDLTQLLNKKGLHISVISSKDAADAKDYIEMVYDYGKALEKAAAAKKELESGQGALANTLGGLGPEARTAIQGYSEMFARVHALNDDGSLKTDDNGNYVYADQKTQDAFADQINNIIKTIPDDYEGNEITIYLMKKLQDGIDDIDDAELKRQMENTLKEITGNLQLTGTFTWSGVIDSLNKYSASLQTTNKALGELTENGYVSNETFAELAKTMDSLNFEDIFASFSDQEEAIEYLNGLCQAMEDLEVAYDANTGAVDMNVASLEYLQDAQERAAKGKIKNMIKDLAASKASAESQVAYIDAQIKAVDAMIRYMGDSTDQTISMDELKSKADAEYTSTFDSNMKAIHNGYVDITGDSLEWAEATIHNIGKVTEAWSAYWQALRNKDANASDLKKKAEELTSGSFSYWDSIFDETALGKNIGNYEGLKKDSEEGKKLLKDLQDYKAELEEAKIGYSKSVFLYTSQIDYLTSLLDADLSKWGTGASKAVEAYVSRLEEMLDLITHIERETQKLGIYQNLYEEQTGKKAIDNLKTQIELVEHLTEDYEKAYELQKDRLNMKAREIEGAYGAVVEFAEDGSYKIFDNAYNALNDESKEAFDDLIEQYDDLIDKTDDYYNNLIDQMREEKKLRQEYVDTYIKAEDELVEAIKSREQKILDAKLEAIDKEIEAIEKAAEARRKAREEETAAKELSSMQVDLQRALMDSSGASATQILDIQKQIKEKQQEMADESFDTMVDDMKTQLEEEKEMEQQLFNERLDEMDWYWEEVDRIMSEGTSSILETMQMYLDEYTQSSELQQVELLKGWEDTFGRAVAIGKSGASEMQGIVSRLQNIINGVDVNNDVAYLLGTARAGYKTTDVLVNQQYKYAALKQYASGGLVHATGPAWLDGTSTHPEAVLNAMQTKAFLSFTDDLAALRAGSGVSTNSSIVIDNISFNVESMSSVADGEKAFNTFVDKFKEIGAKQGISILGTANRN